jgi:hypothetical protein
MDSNPVGACDPGDHCHNGGLIIRDLGLWVQTSCRDHWAIGGHTIRDRGIVRK